MKTLELIKSIEDSTHPSIKLHRLEHHNPDCMIVQETLDNDTMVCVSITLNTRVPLFEYYSGENYVPSSKKRSCSRVWYKEGIPSKFQNKYKELKTICEHFLASSY